MGRVRLLTLTLISHASVGVSRRETKFVWSAFPLSKAYPLFPILRNLGLVFFAWKWTLWWMNEYGMAWLIWDAPRVRDRAWSRCYRT